MVLLLLAGFAPPSPAAPEILEGVGVDFEGLAVPLRAGCGRR